MEMNMLCRELGEESSHFISWRVYKYKKCICRITFWKSWSRARDNNHSVRQPWPPNQSQFSDVIFRNPNIKYVTGNIKRIKWEEIKNWYTQEFLYIYIYPCIGYVRLFPIKLLIAPLDLAPLFFPGHTFLLYLHLHSLSYPFPFTGYLIFTSFSEMKWQLYLIMSLCGGVLLWFLTLDMWSEM